MPALTPIRFGSSPEGTPKRPLVAGAAGAVPANDPYWDFVVLLMGFDGADGSTGAPGMNDESISAHGTAGIYGSAQINANSLLTDGNADGIHFPYTADWKLSSANSDQFTVEAFVTPAGAANLDRHFVGQNGAVGFESWFLATYSDGQLWFRGSTHTGSGDGDWPLCKSTGLTWTIGQQYAIAADKDATGKVRLYRDGVMVANCTPVNSSLSNANLAVLSIGSMSVFTIPFANGHSWNGLIDELRITKGIARYADDAGYTVPTIPFPRG